MVNTYVRAAIDGVDMLRKFDTKTSPFARETQNADAAKAPQSVAEVHTKASLASLYLATKQAKPLQVPPHPVVTPSAQAHDYFFKHLVPAAQVDDNLLLAQVSDPRAPSGVRGQYFILGDVIGDTRGALIRGMRKPDDDVQQIYMVKEIPLFEGGALNAASTALNLVAASAARQELMAMAHEVDIQAAIAHPMTPHFELLTQHRLYLVMPQLDADVSHVLRNVMSEQQGEAGRALDMGVRTAMAFNILESLSRSLYQLHAKNYAHQDIKLENMALRQDGVVYLIDFNAAAKGTLGAQQPRPQAATTVGHAAPEVVHNLNHDGRSADMWSLGVALLTTLLAKNPFVEETPDGAADVRRFNETFYAAWQMGIEQPHTLRSPQNDVAKDVALVHAQLQQHAAVFYPIILRLLDGRPTLRAAAEELAARVADIDPSSRPGKGWLMRELRLQSKLMRMPVARAIGEDARLMRRQPGERKQVRPDSRRANSVDTLLRPFVNFWNDSLSVAPAVENHVAHAQAQKAFKDTPRFFEVEAFLANEDERLNAHLAQVPLAVERFYNAPLPGDAT